LSGFTRNGKQAVYSCKTVVFNVGEIALQGATLCVVGGDFMIYEIWGAISVSRGAISAG